jgi:hypothetical protein
VGTVNEYPQHEKLKSLARERDGAQLMLEALNEQGYVIAKWSDDDDDDRLYPVYESPDALIGKALGIDWKAFSAEKDAMYQELVKRPIETELPSHGTPKLPG